MPSRPERTAPRNPSRNHAAPAPRGPKRPNRPGANSSAGSGSGSSGPKVDLFASFDTGTPPDLNATFAELGMPERLVRELMKQGIDRPFPIQAATMADCLAGRDVLGRGRTGSGKTLAFVLPVLTRLANSTSARRPGRPRALILVPTRELAVQIKTVADPYAHALSLNTTTIFGGVGAAPQIKALRAGVDIVIACPGRLDDHINGHFCSLDAVEITVLDEADHMADMGFLPSVKKLLDRTPRNGQRLLFSATLDNGIDTLVRQYLQNPILRSVDPAEAVESKMTHHILQVGADDRVNVLRDLAAAPGRVLAFTRTKHGAKKLAKTLTASGVPAVEMHGNLSQNVRIRNLEAFRSGVASAMIATDVAARGIHVDDVALVVHFDPPVDHKAYLHRSGRTARAGAEGTVITLMASSQVAEVKDLAKRAGISPTITHVSVGHPLLQELAPGERVFVDPSTIVIAELPPQQQRSAKASRPSRPTGRAQLERLAQRRPERERGEAGRPSDSRPDAPQSQRSAATTSRPAGSSTARPGGPSAREAGQSARPGGRGAAAGRAGAPGRSGGHARGGHAGGGQTGRPSQQGAGQRRGRPSGPTR